MCVCVCVRERERERESPRLVTNFVAREPTTIWKRETVTAKLDTNLSVPKFMFNN